MPTPCAARMDPRSADVGARPLHSAGVEAIDRWFTANGWAPFEFQREAWASYLAGKSGLIHAPTGMGKTHAAWLGPVIEYLEESEPRLETKPTKKPTAGPTRIRRDSAEPLRVLWITPLRALAADTTRSLAESARALNLPWTVERRTGDTAQSIKAKQRQRLPTALVTTPESLSLLLSYRDARERLSTVRCVVVDEWHELIGSKRGVQVELALARLRTWNPRLSTIGVSATLGNTEEAAVVLLGPRADPLQTTLIRGHADKQIDIQTLLPDQIERFPWSGHLGTRLLMPVIDAIERAGTTLLFTNTRSQAEIWFRQITLARPDWLGQVAVHHGSLDRDLRDRVEQRLDAAGGFAVGDPQRLRCVVCTSSLDLGVDYAPVDQVIQIGSPKGVARLLQRAGRSGHQPGAKSRLIGVPTHAMELVEYAAAKRAIELKQLESRRPVRQAFDVLAQHVVTVAAGGGFDEASLRAEVQSTHAFAGMTDEQWGWVMDFVRRGGPCLTAYPRYVRVAPDEQAPSRWGVASPTVMRWHRLNIGTIVADMAMQVALVSGRRLGTIEEGFIGKLKPGDKFVFGGRVLELVRVRDMTAYARKAKGSGTVPQWDGGRMPLSSHLSGQVVELIDQARTGRYESPEMQAARPLLELQAKVSRLPAPDEALIEVSRTRAGHHAFVFPFAGRQVHEALGSLLALRMTRRSPMSVSSVATDYGIEVLAPEAMPEDEGAWRELLSPENLLADLIESLNTTQLARRQFREIARVAGLIMQGYPGQRTPARQVQASSEMFYEVFRQFDPGNLLLEQAQREMLEGQIEVQRLVETLERVRAGKLVIVPTASLSPFAFPLWAERLRTVHASSEAWSDRVRKMVVELEADTVPPVDRPRATGAKSPQVTVPRRKRKAVGHA